jgi:hypothetical protein
MQALPAEMNGVLTPRYSGGRQRQGEPRFETTRATVFQLQFAAHGER